MHRFLPRNDHVRNKDCQDPSVVLKLTDKRFIEFLRSLDFVVHTIIPETDRFTDNYKVGMYPRLISVSVSVGPYGSIFFLIEGENDGQKTSSLYTAKLHNPVKNITLVRKGILSAKEVNCCQSGSLVYLVGNDSPIQFVECEKELLKYVWISYEHTLSWMISFGHLCRKFHKCVLFVRG